jgi:hypothetical protein
VVLVQCTLERDPRRKIDDINVRLWSDWISFGADPMPALAVPACLSGELLSGLRYGAQLILERLRLAGLLTGQDATPDIQTWVADQLRQILDENE